MPEKSVASRQQFEPIAWRQTVVLSLALALNCIATAFGAGLTGLTAIPVAITVGVCSFLSVGVGNYMGRYTKANLQKNWMEIAASIAMMGLGILEMVV